MFVILGGRCAIVLSGRESVQSGFIIFIIFIVCSYMYCRLISIYKKREGWDPINRFSPATILYVCLKPGPRFPCVVITLCSVILGE